MDSKLHPQRLYWIIAGAAFSAAAAVIFFQNEAFYRDFLGYFSSSGSPEPAQFRSARLTIDFGNGKKRAFEGQVMGGMTIISALKVSQAAGKFEAVTDQRGRVVGIDGVKNDGKRWEVYRNGEAVSELPGHVEINPGDKIVFRYE